MMRTYWRTLSFGFGVVCAAASFLRLAGVISIDGSADCAFLLVLFALCAAVSGADLLLRAAPLTDWLRVLLLAGGSWPLTIWSLSTTLRIAPGAALILFSAALTLCGLTGAALLNKLTSAALVVEINEELKVFHDGREERHDEDYPG